MPKKGEEREPFRVTMAHPLEKMSGGRAKRRLVRNEDRDMRADYCSVSERVSTIRF